MITLTKPNSTIIQQGDKLHLVKDNFDVNMFNTDGKMDKVKLGVMVKWLGGDHVIQHNQRYYICEEIQDADYEEI